MTSEILLRAVTDGDLPIFFEQQLDKDANFMAAFTAKDPTDRDAFMAHWAKILADPGITIRTILVDGQVAGHVLVYGLFGEPEVSYWIGKAFWGKGVASQALAQFLRHRHGAATLRSGGQRQPRLAPSPGKVRLHDQRRG